MVRNKAPILIFAAIILINIFLLFQINFINSQELTEITEISSADFTYHATGYEVSQNGEIIFNSEDSKLIINQGQENEIIIEGTSGIKVSPLGKISVTESGSAFILNGNEFKNIESGSIELDQTTGKITKANFFTNENLGNYNINGNEFNVPSNSKFIYNSKEGFEVSEGTKVIETQKDIQIKSDGIFDYKENKISGVLNFDSEKNAFIKAKEKIIINGVSIENQGKGPDFPIFFDKNSAEISEKLEYIVADHSKNLFAFKEAGGNLPRNIRIEFNKDNYLFDDIMDEKDYLFIGEGGVNPGYLEITRQGENLPILKTQGSIEVNPDEKRFLFEGENIIFKTGTNAWPIPEDRSMISGTVPMVFESQDRKVVGLIPDNDDKRFYWTTKGGEVSYGPVSKVTEEQLGIKLPEEITKTWAENSQVTQDIANTISTFANNLEFQKTYKESLAADKNLKNIYNTKLEKIENEILVNSGKEQELREAMSSLENGRITSEEFSEIIEEFKSEGMQHPSISFNELEKETDKKTVDSIKDALKNRVKLNYEIYSALLKEKDLDINEYKLDDEFSKVISSKELKALNECVGRGNSFDLCFDENYRYIGLKTFLCIKSNRYCSTLTPYSFNKMRTE
ncbi:MAG: hypothetical protein Q8O84_05335 [Nanoarchaeota archaeon]|nr:hypothetical protein [Nanoarchaeota archaeon]